MLSNKYTINHKAKYVVKNYSI